MREFAVDEQLIPIKEDLPHHSTTNTLAKQKIKDIQ